MAACLSVCLFVELSLAASLSLSLLSVGPSVRPSVRNALTKPSHHLFIFSVSSWPSVAPMKKLRQNASPLNPSSRKDDCLIDWID